MNSKDGQLPRKLNLGCGKDIKNGYLNLDKAALPGVDIVCNIEQLPLPFADSSFDEVLCNDVLEHVQYIPILKDIHRILASGGKLHIRVPHFTSKNNAIDPTHIRTFSIETFDFFSQKSRLNREAGYYMFDFSFGSIEKARIDFERSSRFFFYNGFVEKWVNKSKYRQQLYEATGLSRLFPAQNILITFLK